MKLKVCGLKDPQTIEQLSHLAIDYIGFNFYKSSPEFIGDCISFDFVRNIPKHIQKAGVFVNEDSYSIFSAVARYDLDVVQLHGNESEAVCRELKPYVKVMKAFGIHSGFDFKALESYMPCVDYFLLDFGGSHHMPPDYGILRDYPYHKPFFLSGATGFEAFDKLRNIRHEQLFALDLNPGFETEPGLKDPARLEDFIRKLGPDHEAKHPA